MKEKLLQYKRQIGIAVILILSGILFYHLMDQNYGFYETTIGTIESIEETTGTLAQGLNGEQEQYYNQELTILIRNGENEGQTVTIESTYGESQMKTTKYSKGEDVFLAISTSDDGSLKASISGIKRDKYLAALLYVFVILMAVIAGRQGALTLLSLCINIGIFAKAVFLYIDGEDFVRMSFVMAAVFTIVTLGLLGGVTRKSVGAIISCLLTVAITFGIYELVCIFVAEPPYEMMEYIVSPDDLQGIFTAGTIIACLGAVMDVAITMNSSIHEIIDTTGTIGRKELFASIRMIGHDICGTMISVLFFTFISGTFPGMMIKIKNGYGLITLFRYGIVFESTRFLVGAIGIVLAIPVSAVVAVCFTRRGAITK